MATLKLFSKCLPRAAYSSFAVSRDPHPKTKQFGVPPLAQSVEKYLRYTKPLVPHEQWKKTCQVAEEFLKSSQATELQSMLLERAKLEDNWLFDWWLESYLASREPIVVHSNPALRMRTMNFRSDNEWLTHAAAVIHGVLQFKKTLESEELKTEFTPGGSSAICMAQNYAILANCRIPGIPHDRLLKRRGGTSSTRDVEHVCVLYRNRLFQLPCVGTPTHTEFNIGLIYRQLEHIVQHASNLPPAPPMGILTTLPRDSWSQIHAKLRQDFQNANILSSIENSLFVLCLDESANLPDEQARLSKDSNPNHELSARETVSSLNLLHGNLVNSGNRWFDKSIEFIVSRDGSVGANFEHTAADAGAWVSLVEHVHASLEKPFNQVSRLPNFDNPQEIQWDLITTVDAEIDHASDLLKRLIDSVEAQYGLFKTFGSKAIKQCQLSPDAFFQVALQLAYSRLHPDLPPPPTYESGSLRRFHLGRTDTIRSCSEETVAFTKCMSNPKSTPKERADLLRQAIIRHKEYTTEVTDGQGFDRHLLGLRLLSSSLKSTNLELYKHTQLFFTDPTYAQVNHYRLSTSQVRSKDDVSVIFGPVVPDGYGLCYNIHSDHIHVVASAFRPSTETQPPSKLIQQVFIALEDMIKLVRESS